MCADFKGGIRVIGFGEVNRSSGLGKEQRERSSSGFWEVNSSRDLWRSSGVAGDVAQMRARCAVSDGADAQRAGGGVEQAERRDGSAGVRRDGARRAQGRDGGAVARRGRDAVVRAGVTPRLKTEEQRWYTALGVQGYPRGPTVAQATTRVETRLAGAAGVADSGSGRQNRSRSTSVERSPRCNGRGEKKLQGHSVWL
ncbi:hypothetical protein U1Q18_016492 [Sarracenia purpurea var. burkii]